MINIQYCFKDLIVTYKQKNTVNKYSSPKYKYEYKYLGFELYLSTRSKYLYLYLGLEYLLTALPKYEYKYKYQVLYALRFSDKENSQLTSDMLLC